MAGGRRIVGVDVGGTFTDLVLLDPEAPASVTVAKVPTTPEDQAQGVLAALDAAGVDAGSVGTIVHGTTTTTNALLERKIARTGLITTQGFRDVLELGRRTRPQPYGMTGVFEPLIERQLRLEVPERIDWRGRVVVPLDEAAVADAARRLLAAGCEAVVIHFLHAYADPTHERRADEIVRALWPNAYVTLGHAVIAEYREFERGTTAAVAACVQPVLDRYLTSLDRALRRRGFAGELLIMQGNGGTVTAELAAGEAAKTVMSGPASGVIAAAWIGRQCGYPDLVTYDMGGTSSDVAVIRGGEPAVTDELELDYGMPIHTPMVDVTTIGAGGGSIARVDDAGLLRVGPESAGAVPGPIAYGRGGRRPTITDADLVLGRLDPERLLAVERPVAATDVADIIGREIGAPLGLAAVEAAAAILRVAHDRMAGAVRLASLARGHDPRDLALFAFGGAGPLHATALATELGIPTVLIPARPGITNAIGCAIADLRHDAARTLNRPLETLEEAELRAVLDEQAARGRDLLAREGAAIVAVDVTHGADMQFRGQTHVLTVPLDTEALDRGSLRAAFERAYQGRFGIALPEIGAMLVSARTRVVGRRAALDPALFAAAGEPAATVAEAVSRRRAVWLAGGWHDTPILRRDRLPRDAVFAGPAIVEQMDTTVLIEPGWTARVDRVGNLVLEALRAGS